METLTKIKEHYYNYIDEVQAVYQKARPTDGLFGFGNDPRNNPCHTQFYNNIAQELQTFCSSFHDQEEAFLIAQFMITFPSEYKESPIYWFMYAAQGLCKDLIPLLTKDQCSLLFIYLKELYPRKDWLPAQKNIYSLLQRK